MPPSPERDLVAHMAEQEKRHFERFDAFVKERKVRPTALMPLWHVAGFALGAVTARMGSKAAMACTVAVESVINDHYAEQKSRLDDKEKTLAGVIEEFRVEEMEHHDSAMAHGAEEADFYPLLSSSIKLASRMAIWLSTKM